MQAFTRHIFGLRDTATDAANEARSRLVQLLHNGDSQLGPVIAEMLHLQAYARWWRTVTDHIEQQRMDAAAALTRTRTAARHTLLDQVTPRSDCPFTYGHAVAFIEATRHFYHDTASLEIESLPRSSDSPPSSGLLPPAATPTSSATDTTTTSYLPTRRPM